MIRHAPLLHRTAVSRHLNVIDCTSFREGGHTAEAADGLSSTGYCTGRDGRTGDLPILAILAALSCWVCLASSSV
jgi:hypothetical protein